MLGGETRGHATNRMEAVPIMAHGRSSKGCVEQIGDDRWRVRVSAGRDGRTGKRRVLTASVVGSRRVAEVAKTRLLAQAGRLPAGASAMTLRELFDGMYLPWVKENRRLDTWRGYEIPWRVHIAPALGDVRLDRLSAEQVDAMLAGVPTDGARAKALATLRQGLRWAMRRRLVASVVTDAVSTPRPRPYEPRVLTSDEARALLRAMRGSSAEAAVLLALGCGLRRSEICGLDWCDVDLGAREVSVRRSYVVTSAGKQTCDPKTPRSRRVVSIPAGVAARLAEIRPAGAVHVMEDADGGRLDPDVVSRTYDSDARAAGVRWTTLKDLRHSSATLALAAGVDVVTVSRRLGHSNVSTTDAFYLRPRGAADRRAADALDDIL